MKIEWEEKDIRCGRYTTSPTESGKICATRTYKIGFYPWSKDAEESRYCLISICDGMVGKAKTKAELAESLTKSGAEPIATDHLVDLIKSLHRQNEGVEGTAGV
jgi:hypothetical protein